MATCSRGERVIRRRGVGVDAVDVLAEQAERIAGGHALVAEEQHRVHPDVAHVVRGLQLHQLIDVAEDLVVLVAVRARDEAVDRVGALGVGEVAEVRQRVRPDQVRARRVGVLAEVVVRRAARVGRSVGEEHHHVARPGQELGVGGVEVRDVRGDDPVGVGHRALEVGALAQLGLEVLEVRCRCRWDGRSAGRSPPGARRSSRWCPRARWRPGRWAAWRTAGSAPGSARTRAGVWMPTAVANCSQSPAVPWLPGGSLMHIDPDWSTRSTTFTGKPLGSGGSVHTRPRTDR